VPLRSWIGLFVFVFVFNLLLAFCGAGAQATLQRFRRTGQCGQRQER